MFTNSYKEALAWLVENTDCAWSDWGELAIDDMPYTAKLVCFLYGVEPLTFVNDLIDVYRVNKT